jgi:predicted SAM-dependent methyltransferase
MHKLNFGSGPGPLPGWLNIDISPEFAPDVIADLRSNLPFKSSSIDFIHSEDFLCQLKLEEGESFLAECRRILKPSGVLRLLTPDMEKLVRTYLHDPQWLVDTWNKTVGVALMTETACEVVNLAMRLGFQFQYDRQVLTQIAEKCGLRAVVVEYNQSSYPELRQIDLRKPSESVSMYFECTPI